MDLRAESTTSDVGGRSQRGSTLIEVIVAIMLLGTIGVALINGFFSLVTASDTHRDVADAEAGAWQFSEWLSSLDTAVPTTCRHIDEAMWLYLGLNGDATTTVHIDAHRAWNGNAATLDDPSTWPEITEPGACDESNPSPVQYIAFTVTAQDGTERSGSVVIRDNLP